MSSGARVLVARALPGAGLDLLRERFTVETGVLEPPADPPPATLRGADALVADPTVPVDSALLDTIGPSLRIVANFAVGYDNIELDACRERGVVTTNTPDVLTNATAELTLALMLAAARRLGEAERLARAGAWEGWHPEQLLGSELSDSTVAIIGLGRIGGRLAELLAGFSARLVYSARSRRGDLEERLGLVHMGLDEAIAEGDFVSLHLPLTPETRGVIDAAALARFKPGAILVNAARGGLVETDALVKALRTGPLAAAGLDVYEDEPNIPPALLELENVVLAPHIGSATVRARNGMAKLVAENVIAVLEGGEPLTPISRS